MEVYSKRIHLGVTAGCCFGSIQHFYKNPVKNISKKIIRIYRDLASMDDLYPSKKVNKKFSELVAIVLSTSIRLADEAMTDPRIKRISKRLRVLCSKGEYLLENHWAKKINNSDHPKMEIKKFPYYANYKKVSDSETKSIKKHYRNHSKKLLFIGCGPLPLSAILLASRHGFLVDALDIDEQACISAKVIVKKLGLSEKIKIVQGDIGAINNLGKYKIIIVAALAGSNSLEKKAIAREILDKISSKTLVIFRGASHLGTLLYQEVTSTHLNGFRILDVIHNRRDVINPIILTRKII